MNLNVYLICRSVFVVVDITKTDLLFKKIAGEYVAVVTTIAVESVTFFNFFFKKEKS